MPFVLCHFIFLFFIPVFINLKSKKEVQELLSAVHYLSNLCLSDMIYAHKSDMNKINIGR